MPKKRVKSRKKNVKSRKRNAKKNARRIINTKKAIHAKKTALRERSKKGIHAKKEAIKKIAAVKRYNKKEAIKKISALKPIVSKPLPSEKLKKLPLKKYKIKKGWFAERGEHALAAKGIGVRKKELLRYKYRYSVFIFISLVLAIASLIKNDLFSCIIGTSIMFLSLIFYMGAVERNERRTIFYISIWPFALAISIASIFKKNFFSFILGILIMFLSSFTLMIIKSKIRKESITKIVRELQKERKKTETDFDKLLILLEELKRLKISEIARVFNIEKKKAGEWARIMEENNLAFLHYPAFGEEELRIKCK